MTDLRTLKEKIDAATGPDRELDARVSAIDGLNFTWCDFETGCYHGDCEDPGCGGPLGLHDERHSYPSDWRKDDRLPRYTASIDAALALVERVGPKDTDVVDILLTAIPTMIEVSGGRPENYVSALPRFILSALLAALIAQEEG